MPDQKEVVEWWKKRPNYWQLLARTLDQEVRQSAYSLILLIPLAKQVVHCSGVIGESFRGAGGDEEEEDEEEDRLTVRVLEPAPLHAWISGMFLHLHQSLM